MQMARFLVTPQDPEQMRPAPGTESARQPAKDGPVEEPRTVSTDRDKGSQGATPNKGSTRTAREKSGFSYARIAKSLSRDSKSKLISNRRAGESCAQCE